MKVKFTLLEMYIPSFSEGMNKIMVFFEVIKHQSDKQKEAFKVERFGF